jgi:hypothetical protein
MLEHGFPFGRAKASNVRCDFPGSNGVDAHDDCGNLGFIDAVHRGLFERMKIGRSSALELAREQQAREDERARLLMATIDDNDLVEVQALVEQKAIAMEDRLCMWPVPRDMSRSCDSWRKIV